MYQVTYLLHSEPALMNKIHIALFNAYSAMDS